jgi:hypothetical protein
MVDSFFNYKKAIIETNTQALAHAINYKYSPCLSSTAKMFEVNIVLFKALKVRDVYNDPAYTPDLFRYYVDNVKCNHWSEILPDKNFEVINMDDNHFDWIKNEVQVIEICKVLK